MPILLFGPIAREKLLQEATRIAVADVAFIPLHNQMNIWGMSPKYNYTARQDEETHAMTIHPAQWGRTTRLAQVVSWPTCR